MVHAHIHTHTLTHTTTAFFCLQVYFEEEAEEYERSVEKLYPLCVSCEERVASEISRKNQIIRHHLLTTRKNHKAKAKPKV